MSTEAEAIADLAVDATTSEDIPAIAGDAGTIVYSNKTALHHYDHEALLDAPRRVKARVAVHTPDSLVLYVRKHGHETAPADRNQVDTARADQTEKVCTALYADVDKVTVTAVLNGHGAGGAIPGWGDHRAALALRYAPEWLHWTSQDRVWLAQVEFGEHLEEGYGEIVEPSAAEMLELAQTMSAKNRLEFRSQQLLGNGQRQFTYHETIDARAGENATITIPSKFKLGLICFEGQTEGYPVDARFQFRINDGALRVRYLLTRPHDVIRTAFDDVVSDVEHGVGLVAFRGTPPA
ncbi:MAG TPA: DUF2303 family protein [Acidimicrobiales bacterium]|jgi:uncharacterized protein YfdQ (DUF2303 family)|nr:DUF2303 family protein [Acidimicrobiales bacterium]